MVIFSFTVSRSGRSYTPPLLSVMMGWKRGLVDVLMDVLCCASSAPLPHPSGLSSVPLHLSLASEAVGGGGVARARLLPFQGRS